MQYFTGICVLNVRVILDIASQHSENLHQFKASLNLGAHPFNN